MLAFIIKQSEFIFTTTQDVSDVNDFLISQSGMVLYNSTCMCLQTIGETLKQIDSLTKQKFLSVYYGETPWHSIFGLRNIISHEYATTDPEEIFYIIHQDLAPLLTTIRQILSDINNGTHDHFFQKFSQ